MAKAVTSKEKTASDCGLRIAECGLNKRLGAVRISIVVWLVAVGLFVTAGSGSAKASTVATPSFSPVAGTYNAPQSVLITCGTAGATIHYTTSGVDPTESDLAVEPNVPVVVEHSLTLKAKAWLTGWTASSTKTGSYIIAVATPVFTPRGGRYTSDPNVVITCATPGAVIHYTIGHDPNTALTPDPTESDTVIASGGTVSVSVEPMTVLKARAYKDGWPASGVKTARYLYRTPVPQGSIVAWGDYYGQATPPAGDDFVAVAAGYYHGLALKSDGSIVGWGGNYYGQAAPPAGNDFVAIAAGGYHSLAMRSNGSIVGWGANYFGQAAAPDGNNFVAVSAGGYHSLALKSDGSIVGWGDDYYGQATPPNGNDFVAISAGENHSLALRADGTIAGWGDNYTYADGGRWYLAGQATPPAGSDFVAISAGFWSSLAMKRDGSVVEWGFSHLAIPPDTNCVPVFPTGISAGVCSKILRSDGTIYCHCAGDAAPAGSNYFVVSTAGDIYAGEGGSGSDSSSLALRLDCPVLIAGDLNKDCVVDAKDFETMAGYWLSSGCIAPDWCGGAEMARNGIVDFKDFAVIAAHWRAAGGGN